MSLSDAIGQIDQIVQWEQQLADPAALTQTTSTAGVAVASSSGSTSTGSAGASFANALAQAQSQDAGAALTSGAANGADGSSPLATAGSALPATAGSALPATAGLALPATAAPGLLANTAATGLPALLSGGNGQLLATVQSGTAGGTAAGSASAAAPALSAEDPRIQAMIQQANSLVGKPYVWGGGHGGWGPQTGYDCSGFVSAVLHAGGYLSSPQDTTTLPQSPGIEPGPGQYVTIYDRDAPGEQGHVIIEIDGQFYESGGEQGSWGGGGGVAPISTPSPEYLATFNQVLHPAGL